MAGQFRKFSDQQVQVSVVEILALMAGLPGRQEIFRQTGATHAIFLAEAGQGKVVLGAEDVGRHNAFDKVIGQALMKNLAMGDKIALLSGRASFEMVLKRPGLGFRLCLQFQPLRLWRSSWRITRYNSYWLCSGRTIKYLYPS